MQLSQAETTMYSPQTEVRAIGTISLAGRLDAVHAPQIRQRIERHIQNGETRLILDMRDVHFLDSSALTVFVNALEGTRAIGGDMVIWGPTAPVRSILELSQLRRILAIVDSHEAAVTVISN